MQLHISFSDLYEFGKNEHSEKDTVGFILKYCDDIDKVMNELSQEDSSIILKFSDKIVSHYGGLGKMVAECGMTEFTSNLLLSYLENGKINEIIEQVANDDIKKFLNILLKEGSIVNFEMDEYSMTHSGNTIDIKNCDDIPSSWVWDSYYTKCNDSVKQLIIYYLKNTFGEVYLDDWFMKVYTNKKPIDYFLDNIFDGGIDPVGELLYGTIEPNFNLIKNNRNCREALEVLNENDTYEEFYDKFRALPYEYRAELLHKLFEDTDYLEITDDGVKRMKLI